MTDRQTEDELAEFAAELKLLAEAVLERVEPVLRRGAAAGSTEWASCSWCPVCAAAALIRGERHDVLAAIADHGTAIVTVLREALAGVPVDPVRFDPETGATHEHSTAYPGWDAGSSDAAPPGTGAGPDHTTGRSGAAATSVPGADRSGTAVGDAPADPAPGDPGATAPEQPRADGPKKRRFRRGGSGYVDIPVTVRR
ncbi:hypothetical protein [Nocardia sp. NPDC057353]|uniref:hypothetical protein n=1 Tax=Nocardia sp. NPDC057353 TaxID=3346104 RepID=UPI0036307248